MRGELVSNTPGAPLNFDNKLLFVMKVDTGTIGMRSPSLDVLMNRYIFGYPNPPLRNLHIGDRRASSSSRAASSTRSSTSRSPCGRTSRRSNGMIRIHPTKIDICGINGIGLLKAVGMTLEKMLKLPKERGITAQGNDLLLDPHRRCRRRKWS